MKSLFYRMTIVFTLVFQLSCCADRLSSRYSVEFPQAPQPWLDLLGDPCWTVEWFDSAGQMQKEDVLHGGKLEIALPVTWTNPVTAWPWWPAHNLHPGIFRPAGALFPHDVPGHRLLHLSWEAGPDTVFYRELVFANNGEAKKIPANFDWLRFRALFTTDILSEAVVNDPWLVDWKYVAEKTVSSNFDRRRLVPETVTYINIPVSGGIWHKTSPFAEPLYFEEGGINAFHVRSGINVLISAEGILRYTGNTWTFMGF